MKKKTRERAEREILGTIFLYETAFFIASDYVNEKTFLNPKHQAIFKACRQLAAQNLPINAVAILHKTNVKGYELGQIQHFAISETQLPFKCFALAEEAVRHYCAQLAQTEALIHRKSTTIKRGLEQLADVFQSENEDLFEALNLALEYTTNISQETANKFAEVYTLIERKAQTLRNTHGGELLLRNVEQYIKEAPTRNTELFKMTLKSML